MKTPEVVVVTGASAGVGRATAVAFAQKGASVGLIARGQAGLEAAAAEVERAGGRPLVLPLDVSSPDDVERAAERVERELGPIDVWVNDAMLTIFSPFSQIRPEEFRRVTEVTYLGYVYGTMSALKRMVPRDSGVVVQVGSALAYRSIPLQAAYCGAKFGIRGFTDSVRTELLHRHSGVHITMVQLPAVNTPQFSWAKTNLPLTPRPVPPVFQPEVIAEAIMWAAAHRKREVIVGMPSLAAIWANKFIPGLLDRYLARTGYRSQQTDRPVDPGRQDNLFSPLAGGHRTHGEFDDEAHRVSWEFQAAAYKNWIIAAGILAAGVLFARRLASDD
ncbi:MAG TPA: SDR family oxidoreductase [Thermodesulfobacteriota bacterium]|nr:SDR family oxidoreductase [Thermodesulfobacteriota bacterium]